MTESSVGKLNRHLDTALSDLSAIETQLSESRKELAAEETQALLAERPVAQALVKKVSGLAEKQSQLEERIAVIRRAVSDVRQQEQATKDERTFKARQALKKVAGPKLKRLYGAIDELRNATLDLFMLLEQPENVPLIAVDFESFLFPPENPRDLSVDIVRRTNQMRFVTAVFDWVRAETGFNWGNDQAATMSQKGENRS
jgi:hypothetical protein